MMTFALIISAPLALAIAILAIARPCGRTLTLSYPLDNTTDEHGEWLGIGAGAFQGFHDQSNSYREQCDHV